MTSKLVKNMNRNPRGSGGFQTRPQDINYGGRKKNLESLVYWYRVFMQMTVAELNSWQENNPESVRTVVSDLAYMRITRAKTDFKEFQEVADRSEGKPTQVLQHSEIVSEPPKQEPILSKEERETRLAQMLRAFRHEGEYGTSNLDPEAIIR